MVTLIGKEEDDRHRPIDNDWYVFYENVFVCPQVLKLSTSSLHDDYRLTASNEFRFNDNSFCLYVSRFGSCDRRRLYIRSTCKTPLLFRVKHSLNIFLLSVTRYTREPGPGRSLPVLISFFIVIVYERQLVYCTKTNQENKDFSNTGFFFRLPFRTGFKRSGRQMEKKPLQKCHFQTTFEYRELVKNMFTKHVVSKNHIYHHQSSTCREFLHTYR